MKAILLSLCCMLAALQTTLAQELILTIPQKKVAVDDTLSVEVLTSDFDSIASTQFSMHWDTSIIHYTGFRLKDLDLVAVGDSDAKDGTVRVSWFDIEGVGESLADNQVFLSLQFQAVGEVGDISPLGVDGIPLAIQVFKATSEPFVFDSIDLVVEEGSVEIIEQMPQGTFEILGSDVMDVPCTDSESGSIELETNQGDVVYDWSGPNGFSSNMQNIENLIAGEYMLTVLDSLGVVLLDTTFIISQPLNALEVINVDVMSSACESPTGNAIIQLSGGTAPFEFTLPSGMQFTQNNIEDLAPGNYPITITDANGCSTLSGFEIGQLDTLFFSLGEDLNACEGEVIEIVAGEFSNYEWSTSSVEPTIQVESDGQFSVTVTNENGCTASDTISLNFIDEVQLTSQQEDIMVCPGNSITLTVSGGVAYEWMDPNNEIENPFSSSVLVQPAENTVYTVVSTSECGTDELDISVALHATTATGGEDVCVPVGETATLNASGGEFYYWSGEEYPLSDYDISNPSTTPDDSTQYFVMIIDENECTTFDTVTVFVADDPVAFIPAINMITPNGDGINDAVDFGDINKFGSNTFRVFNRWGKIVYEKINYQSDAERFSGIYNGKQLPAGNYYYVLSFINDQKIKQALCIVEE